MTDTEIEMLKKRKSDIAQEIDYHRKEILRLQSERIVINYILGKKRSQILQRQKPKEDG